jgi:hypothetical protein
VSDLTSRLASQSGPGRDPNLDFEAVRGILCVSPTDTFEMGQTNDRIQRSIARIPTPGKETVIAL